MLRGHGGLSALLAQPAPRSLSNARREPWVRPSLVLEPQALWGGRWLTEVVRWAASPLLAAQASGSSATDDEVEAAKRKARMAEKRKRKKERKRQRALLGTGVKGQVIKIGPTFGFVQGDEGDGIFFDANACQAFGGKIPPQGVRVTYDVIQSTDGKSYALNVAPVIGEPQGEQASPAVALLQDPHLTRAVAIEASRTLLGSTPGSRDYFHCVNAFGRVKLWERAIGVLKFIRDTERTADSFLYNRLIAACADSGQDEKALALFEEMERVRFEPDVITGNIVMKALMKNAKWEQALELLNDMRRRRPPDIVSYNTAIGACAAAGKWEQALKLLILAEQEAGGADIFTFSSAINACGKGDQWRLSLALLEAALRRGLAPNQVTYAAVIDACARGENPGTALGVFDDMRVSKVSPNVVTYDAAIGACIRHGGYWKQALLYLTDMDEDGVDMDIGVYNSVMRACQNSYEWGYSQRLMWESLDGLLQGAKQRGLKPDTMTYFLVATACEKAGQWKRALGLLGEMKRERVKPDEILYAAVIASCQDSMQWEHALSMLRDMRSEGLVPGSSVYTPLITACEKSSQWELALKLAKEMHGKKLAFSIITFTAIICAYARAGRLQDALKTLEVMKVSGEEPNMLTYMALISACEYSQQWEFAVRMKVKMQQLGMEPPFTTYASLVRVCAAAEQWDWVRQVLFEASDAYQNSEEFSLPWMYSIALNECGQRNNWQFAMVLLSDMTTNGHKPDVPCLDTMISLCERASLNWDEFQGICNRGGLGSWVDHLNRGTLRAMASLPDQWYRMATSELHLRDAALGGDLMDWLGTGSKYFRNKIRNMIYVPSAMRLEDDWEWGKAALKDEPWSRSAGLGTRFSHQLLKKFSFDVSRKLSWGWVQKARHMLRGEDSAAQSWVLFNLLPTEGGTFATLRRSRGAAVDDSDADTMELGGVIESKEEAARKGLIPCESKPHALRVLREALRFDETEPRGVVRLFGSRAPCISCLVAYCQFQDLFPDIRLQVAFDSGRETGRWVQASPASPEEASEPKS